MPCLGCSQNYFGQAEREVRWKAKEQSFSLYVVVPNHCQGQLNSFINSSTVDIYSIVVFCLKLSAQSSATEPQTNAFYRVINKRSINVKRKVWEVYHAVLANLMNHFRMHHSLPDSSPTKKKNHLSPFHPTQSSNTVCRIHYQPEKNPLLLLHPTQCSPLKQSTRFITNQKKITWHPSTPLNPLTQSTKFITDQKKKNTCQLSNPSRVTEKSISPRYTFF